MPATFILQMILIIMYSFSLHEYVKINLKVIYFGLLKTLSLGRNVRQDKCSILTSADYWIAWNDFGFIFSYLFLGMEVNTWFKKVGNQISRCFGKEKNFNDTLCR